MSRKTLVAAVVVAAVLIPAAVMAQTCNFDLRYDPQSVTTMTGTVLTTISYNPGDPAMSPQAVVISSGGQTYTVFLGPGYYVNQAGITFKPGDQITVTGSQRSLSGTSYIVASTVTTPSGTFAFRSATGMPLWACAAAPVCPAGTIPPPPTVSTVAYAPIGAGPTCPSCGTVRTSPQACPQVCPPVGAGPAIPGPLVPFNPANVITISGTVERAYEQQTAEDTVPDMVLVIKQDAPGTRPQRVLVAPASVMAQSGLDLSKGQHIVVQGSPVNIDPDYIVVATQISQGSTVFSLRTCAGMPMWASAVPCNPCAVAPIAPVGAGPTTEVIPPVVTTPPTGAGPCPTCGQRIMNQVCPSSVPPVCPPVQPVCPPAQPVCPPGG